MAFPADAHKYAHHTKRNGNVHPSLYCGNRECEKHNHVVESRLVEAVEAQIRWMQEPGTIDDLLAVEPQVDNYLTKELARAQNRHQGLGHGRKRLTRARVQLAVLSDEEFAEQMRDLENRQAQMDADIVELERRLAPAADRMERRERLRGVTAAGLGMLSNPTGERLTPGCASICVSS